MVIASPMPQPLIRFKSHEILCIVNTDDNWGRSGCPIQESGGGAGYRCDIDDVSGLESQSAGVTPWPKEHSCITTPLASYATPSFSALTSFGWTTTPVSPCILAAGCSMKVVSFVRLWLSSVLPIGLEFEPTGLSRESEDSTLTGVAVMGVAAQASDEVRAARCWAVTLRRCWWWVSLTDLLRVVVVSCAVASSASQQNHRRSTPRNVALNRSPLRQYRKKLAENVT